MTDQTPDWTAGLVPGTLLSFHFPEAEDGKPGKARPCLLIAIDQDETGMRLALAYGTSANTPANRGLDLVLDQEADWSGAGLRRPSRFVLARRITIMPGDPRLSFSRKGAPIIGQIPASHMAELARLTSRLDEAIWLDCLRGRKPRRPRLVPSSSSNPVAMGRLA